MRGMVVAMTTVTLGQPFWGTGLFIEAAKLARAFAFDTLGVHRLEARVVLANGRGNGALRKLGASREAHMRASFSQGGHRVDQALWSILRKDWLRTKVIWGARGALHRNTIALVH